MDEDEINIYKKELQVEKNRAMSKDKNKVIQCNCTCKDAELTPFHLPLSFELHKEENLDEDYLINFKDEISERWIEVGKMKLTHEQKKVTVLWLKQ